MTDRKDLDPRLVEAIKVNGVGELVHEDSYVNETLRRDRKKPSQVLVHLALLTGQCINGGSSVIAKCGLPKTNPIFFALLRESCAFPLLLMIAYGVDGKIRRHVGFSDVPLLVFTAFFLFSNQICFVTGLTIGNPVVGSAWQPSQPIFVLFMAVLLRWESCTLYKLLGVIFAMAGGSGMTLGSMHNKHHGSGSDALVSNLFFLYNCSATAVFILGMRVATQRMPAFTVIAVVYGIATLGILIFALIVASHHDVTHFFCPDCKDDFWDLPLGALFALAYWVLGNSVCCYLMLSWGAKHAKESTHCLAYTAVQPVVAGIIETVLVLNGWNDSHPSNQMNLLNTLQIAGACAVVVGVCCIIIDARQAMRSPAPDNGFGRSSMNTESILSSFVGH